MKNPLFSIISCLFIVTCSNDFERETPFHYGMLFPEKLGFMNMPRPADSYNYPVYPGMEEWLQLSTHKDMLAVLQVPMSIVKNLSTQALIQAIWEHPLLGEIMCFHSSQLSPNYQSCFEEVFRDNNAYIELLGRRDASQALLSRLELVHPFTMVESQALELLLSQSVFVTQLSEVEKRKTVEVAIKIDDLRQNELSIQNSSIIFRRPITCLLIGRAMLAANYAPLVKEVNNDANMKEFLDLGNLSIGLFGDHSSPYYYIPLSIIDLGKQFLNK